MTLAAPGIMYVDLAFLDNPLLIDRRNVPETAYQERIHSFIPFSYSFMAPMTHEGLCLWLPFGGWLNVGGQLGRIDAFVHHGSYEEARVTLSHAYELPSSLCTRKGSSSVYAASMLVKLS